MTGFLPTSYVRAFEDAEKARRAAAGTFTCRHCAGEHPRFPKVGTILCPCGEGGHVACPALATEAQRTSIAAIYGPGGLEDYLASRLG